MCEEFKKGWLIIKEQEVEVESQRWKTEEKRWRSFVYKRSDAAQSVLVMTQLALHIATNHSPTSSLLLYLLSASLSLTLASPKTPDLIGGR